METAAYFIDKLQLKAHVEGGYYREIYKHSHSLSSANLPMGYEGERSLSSTIYYLLRSGQVSKFHQLTSDELWFFHYGSPLMIHIIDEDGELESFKLGIKLDDGQNPQILINAKKIFAAEVIEDDSFALVSCMVSPGFDYRDFRIYSQEELTTIFPQHQELILRFNKDREG